MDDENYDLGEIVSIVVIVIMLGFLLRWSYISNQEVNSPPITSIEREDKC